MAVREIKILGDKVLRKKAVEIGELTPEIIKLAGDMKETMLRYRGIGLAANQVGELKRIITVYLDPIGIGKGVQVLINPVVYYFKGEETAEEGCLSIPGLYADVTRPFYVEVEAQELVKGKLRPITIKAKGLYARVLLHETDHLNGVLFIDRLPQEEARILVAKWKRGFMKDKARIKNAL